MPFSNIFHNKKVFFGLLFLVCVVNCSLIIKGERTADSTLWLDHGGDFISSVMKHDWKGTHLTTKPGVSVMWIAGTISYLTRNTFLHPNRIALYARQSLYSEFIFSLFDLVFAFATIVFLSRIYRATGAGDLGYLFVFLILINPYFSVSRELVWTDKLLTWFIWLSFLAFLCRGTGGRRTSFLFISGCFFGLGLLTKTSAWLTPAYLLAVGLLGGRLPNALNLRIVLTEVLIVILVGVVIFYIFYPAAWSNPYLIVDRAHELTPREGVVFFNFWSALFGYLKVFLEAEPLLFLTFLIILPAYLLRPRIQANSAVDLKRFFIPVVLNFSLLVLVSFFRDQTVPIIMSVRYLMATFPFFLFLTVNMVKSVGESYQTRFFPRALLTFLVLAHLFALAGKLFSFYTYPL
jgi:hypothetical protein